MYKKKSTLILQTSLIYNWFIFAKLVICQDLFGNSFYIVRNQC